MALVQRLSPGTRLFDGRFEVKRLVKAGGMGAVYEVTDRNLDNRTYALKEMTNPTNDPGERQAARDRFISEVQVMMALRHPHIPRVTASFMHDNSFYFVMELIEGIDLSQVLKEQGSPGLSPHDVVSWGLQVLDALNYLHGQTPPIVHRDIKPSNLLRNDKDGRILIIDFGIARVTNPGEGLWIGTPGYAPAEQQGGRPEPRSDLYALGASMHELLTGRKPEDFEFPSFAELGVTLDPQLDAIIAHSLAIWPEDRIGSAQEMSDRLRALEGFSISLPAVSRDHSFESAVADYKTGTLDPILSEVIRRYKNECHTPYLPKNLDYLQFTLACPLPFELLITKDNDRGRVRFAEKQHLMDARLLGEVDPADETDVLRTKAIVEQFLDNYESFKNSSGMFLS